MLLDRARQVAGGHSWVDLSFRPALELLVRSCDDTAALNRRGRRVLHAVVVRHLVNRLLIEAEVRARPEVRSQPVGAAIVVTGLPRTGTTLLHNLLALDPAFRALRLWEALRPVPPDPEGGTPRDELVRRAEAWLEQTYELVPGFRSIHAATAEGPEECDALLQNDFASQHFDDMFDAVSYSEWLATAPLRREYRSYADQLNVLRSGEDGARPWVLKSPSHLGHLDALLEAVPDATIVHCHRHPCEAVPSYASLVLTLRRAYSDEASATRVGRQAMHRAETAVARAMTMRREAGDRFVDVAYRDLVGQPLVAVGRLYEQLGRRLPAAVEASMTTWLFRHPQHQHGRHTYASGTFGLGPEAIETAFSPYLDRHRASL